MIKKTAVKRTAIKSRAAVVAAPPRQQSGIGGCRGVCLLGERAIEELGRARSVAVDQQRAERIPIARALVQLTRARVLARVERRGGVTGCFPPAVSSCFPFDVMLAVTITQKDVAVQLNANSVKSFADGRHCEGKEEFLLFSARRLKGMAFRV